MRWHQTSTAASSPAMTVSAAFVSAVVHVAEQLGVPRHELLEHAGLQPQQLEQIEARTSWAKLYVVLGAAIELTQDLTLGLRVAEFLSNQSFHSLADVAARAQTLRSALGAVNEFGRLIADAPSRELLELDDKASIACIRHGGLPLKIERLLSEVAVIRFWALARSITGNHASIRASFMYASPSYRHEYTRIFGGNASFDQPFTGISFDRDLLDL